MVTEDQNGQPQAEEPQQQQSQEPEQQQPIATATKGGRPSHPGQTEPPESQEQQQQDSSYTLKVNGQERTFTIDELKQAASKAEGAEEKFRQAHELQTKARQGLRMLEVVDELKEAEASGTSPDPKTVGEFFSLLGLDPADVDMTQFTPQQQQQSGDPNTMDNQQQQNQQQQNQQQPQQQQNQQQAQRITADMLDDDVRQTLDDFKQSQIEQFRQKMTGEIRSAVDNDAEINKMIPENMDAADKKKLKDTLFEMTKDDVRSRILSRQQRYGPDMVTESLQTTRSRLKNIGIPTKSKQPPLLDLGPTAGSQYTQEVMAEKPIERVPSTSPDYHENAVKRILQRMVGSKRG